MAKKIGWIALALALLCIALAVAAPFMVPADAIKSQLITRVKALTGRDLAINGAFHVTFFPFAGVRAEQVTLSNPTGFIADKPLMELKSMQVDIALAPYLLHRQIQVKDLVIDAPQLNLYVDKQGVRNWDFAGRGPAAAALPKKSVAGAHPADLSPLKGLMLGNVALTNGTLAYADATGGKQWLLDQLNAKLTLKDIASPLDVNGSATWNEKTVAFKATIGTVQSWLAKRHTTINASFTSELLSLDTQGSWEAAIPYNGKATVTSPSLKQLLAWLMPQEKPLPTPAPLALELSAAVACVNHGCNFSNARLQFDKLDAQGSLRALFSPSPQLDLSLTTNQLDFNPFLPKTARPVADSLLIAPAYADSATRWSTQPIDFSPLKRLNATASIQAGSIVFQHVTVGKTALQAHLQNGKLAINLPNAELYGGKGTAGLTLDGNAAPASLDAHIALRGIQAEPLLKDAAGLSRFSGTGDLSLQVNTHGDSEKAMIDALGGTASMALTNGAIKGFDLNAMVKNPELALQAANRNAAGTGSGQTEFASMSGSFTIAQGIAATQDLAIINALLHVTGQGQINLPGWTIALRLMPQLATMATGKTGISVPVLVEGDMDNPHIHADVKGAVRDALKNPDAFKEQLRNSKDAVKGLKGLLKGLRN